MDSRQAIQVAANFADMVFKSYLGDLSDADLMMRPHAGCNHLAWQLGHLIQSECQILSLLKPGSAPALPLGFAEKHGKAQSSCDDPTAFHTKEEYLALYDTVRAAAAELVRGVSESELDAANPHPDEAFRQMFPTVGSMWILAATHPMMHAGQFVPVRRELGKPVVI